MTFDEFVGDCIDHILVVDTAIDPTGVLAVDDPKSNLKYVRSMARGAIAFVLVALWPKSSLLWSLVRQSKGLVLDADGIYYLGRGNPLSVAGTYDGSEVNTGGADVLISGDIIGIELTWTTPAAAAVAPGPSNPFLTASWEYAEPDSAAAIRRRRKLATRHKVPLHSFEHVGNKIYAAANGLRVTYFPSNFGETATDEVPTGLHLAAMCRFLSVYYGQKAGSSGVQAAGYYDRALLEMIQLLLSGKVDFGPLPPYQGN